MMAAKALSLCCAREAACFKSLREMATCTFSAGPHHPPNRMLPAAAVFRSGVTNGRMPSKWEVFAACILLCIADCLLHVAAFNASDARAHKSRWEPRVCQCTESKAMPA